DIVEAVRVAGKVLNSCGQVLPSTLSNIELVAEMEDGRVIHGESHIPEAGGRIKRLHCEPEELLATPEAIEAILDAELVVLGPGSLFTSIVPNLLIPGIRDAIKRTKAKRIYVCNVVTQLGETTNLTVSDHVEAILAHSDVPQNMGYQLIDAVLVNDQKPVLDVSSPAKPVVFDPERLATLNVPCIRHPLVSDNSPGHHDPTKLAKSLMLWYLKAKRKKSERGALPTEEENKSKVIQRLASFF
ncbi:MAG: YvcK family protein, partial [Cyanobacteria bacterium]|nr:YvcK family protein [Cyanobacteriota bacterium]